MTRFATMAALLGATALCGTAALAQMAPQTTPPATPPTASQTAPQTTPPAASQAAPGATASYTDADVDEFAGAALAVQKIQQDATVPDTDKQTKMSAAVTSSGLTPEKFNAMATASQSDPALMKRIQTAAAAKMKAAPDTAPATGSSGASGSSGSAGADGATAR